MAAPTFVAEYESAWNTGTTPKTASVTVASGDVLVVIAAAEDNGASLGTPTGGAMTWTLRQSHVTASNVQVYVWTATAASAQTFTLSVARSGSNLAWGFNCLRFSGSTGIGASAKAQASGTPSLSLTTTAANSAVVVINGDWNAVSGTTRAWLSGAGAATEVTYYNGGTDYGVYGAYHANAGTAAAKTLGMSAPTGQKYSIAAVEIKGTSAVPQVRIMKVQGITPTPPTAVVRIMKVQGITPDVAADPVVRIVKVQGITPSGTPTVRIVKVQGVTTVAAQPKINIYKVQGITQPTEQAWFVRKDGAWIPAEAYVRIDGAWVGI